MTTRNQIQTSVEGKNIVQIGIDLNFLKEHISRDHTPMNIVSLPCKLKSCKYVYFDHNIFDFLKLINAELY